jgi:hypothetical protein
MIKRIGIIQAIKAINPEAQVTVYGEDYDTIDWNAGTAVISKEDIDAKIVELEAEWIAQEYARNRKEEYDALNQLELISDDTKNGTTTHIDAIDAIKAKYPKP